MNPEVKHVIDTIVIISNVIMFLCMGYFARGLKWSSKKDRPAVIGFAWMMATVAASVVCLWI